MGNQLLRDIDHEWAGISNSGWARRRVATWVRTDDRFAGLRDLGEVVHAIQRGEHNRSRGLCWALLGLVASGDEGGTRTLLQAMVPTLGQELKSLLGGSPGANIDSYGSGDPDQLVVAAANQAIHEMAGTEPKWPIADLRSRTHRLVVRWQRNDRRWTDHNLVDDNVAASCDKKPADKTRTATDELADLLADAAREGTMRDEEIAMMWLTRVAGVPPTETAAQYGATTDVYRRRLRRIEGRFVKALRTAAA